jgi:hypothetical protein
MVHVTSRKEVVIVTSALRWQHDDYEVLGTFGMRLPFPRFSHGSGTREVPSTRNFEKRSSATPTGSTRRFARVCRDGTARGKLGLDLFLDK